VGWYDPELDDTVVLVGGVNVVIPKADAFFNPISVLPPVDVALGATVTTGLGAGVDDRNEDVELRGPKVVVEGAGVLTAGLLEDLNNDVDDLVELTLGELLKEDDEELRNEEEELLKDEEEDLAIPIEAISSIEIITGSNRFIINYPLN
jgi:hypothetical protein